MSVADLNELPLHNITLNLTTIQLTVFTVGLIKFMLLQILLNRKRIVTFFLGLKPHVLSSNDQENHRDQPNKKREFERPINRQKKDDDQSVCSGEVDMVLRRLGIFYHEEKLPSRMEADEIFDIFEERSPSLDEVRQAFEVFDSKRDGYIDESELQKVLCGLGLKEGSEMENCRRMIEVFDEDGDGRIGFGEFVKFMEDSFC